MQHEPDEGTRLVVAPETGRPRWLRREEAVSIWEKWYTRKESNLQPWD